MMSFKEIPDFTRSVFANGTDCASMSRNLKFKSMAAGDITAIEEEVLEERMID